MRPHVNIRDIGRGTQRPAAIRLPSIHPQNDSTHAPHHLVPSFVCRATDPKDSKRQSDALENAVRTINSIISLGDIFGANAAGPSKDKTSDKNNFQFGNGGDKDKAKKEEGVKTTARQGSWVRFRGEARHSSPVLWPIPTDPTESDESESDGAPRLDERARLREAQLKVLSYAVATPLPGRTLGAYLALPLEEYSLLDPSWIAREEGGIFVLSVPMEEMTGLTLMPKVWVRVTPDPATASVAFKGLRASLGTPGLDAIFTLSFDAALSGRDPPPSVGPSSPHDCELHVTATVDAGIKVPPPWSRVPGFLLRNAAGTILSAVMQNVIAAFADLLARDYRRWATGLRDQEAKARAKAEEARRNGPNFDSDGNLLIDATSSRGGSEDGVTVEGMRLLPLPGAAEGRASTSEDAYGGPSDSDLGDRGKLSASAKGPVPEVEVVTADVILSPEECERADERREAAGSAIAREGDAEGERRRRRRPSSSVPRW